MQKQEHKDAAQEAAKEIKGSGTQAQGEEEELPLRAEDGEWS
jgi:hypothetical protein